MKIEFNTQKTKSVKWQNLEIGGPSFVVIGGPCAVESREQIFATAQAIRQSGAVLLRGGLFKMRTSSQSFQGLGSDAFDFIREIKKQMGLYFISEVTDAKQIEDFSEFVDIFQVGSRNMYNYSLLKELGLTRQPVMLKRGFSATYDEWFKAAEYIYQGGNNDVILCERGVRSFEPATRNTLDLAAVAYVKAHTHFPIIVDPSHGTGRRELIAPMALAAVAAGADGIMLETHPEPDRALSDAEQAIDFASFDKIIRSIEMMLPLFGRDLARLTPSDSSSLDSKKDEKSSFTPGAFI